jgi:hypothetical protein
MWCEVDWVVYFIHVDGSIRDLSGERARLTDMPVLQWYNVGNDPVPNAWNMNGLAGT